MESVLIQYTGAGLNQSGPNISLIAGLYYEVDIPLYNFLKNNYRYVIKTIPPENKPEGINFIKLSMPINERIKRPLTELEEIERDEEIEKRARLDSEARAKAEIEEKEKAASGQVSADKKKDSKTKSKKKNVEKL